MLLLNSEVEGIQSSSVAYLIRGKIYGKCCFNAYIQSNFSKHSILKQDLDEDLGILNPFLLKQFILKNLSRYPFILFILIVFL